MKLKALFLFLLLLTWFSTADAQNVYFIKYRESAPKEKVERIVKNKQLNLPSSGQSAQISVMKTEHFAKGLGIRDENLFRIIKADLPEELSPVKINVMLTEDPDIEYIQKAGIYKTDALAPAVTSDSLIDQQWALNKINAFNAWNITRGDSSLIVGVIDTGIDYLHPDLKNKIYLNKGETGWDNAGKDKRTNGIDDDENGFIDDFMGWDFTDRAGFPHDSTAGDYLTWDNDPVDGNFHGTFVAGILAAEADNGRGIAGVAPGVKLLNLRAFDPNGNGEEDDVAAAILYAVENGAKVINMSFGDYQYSYVLRDVIRYAYSRNVVLVASSGNSGSDEPHYPSGYSEVISVGNSTENDYVASNSNYGSTIDLVAPGTSIVSTMPKGSYSSQSGTSAAAPFISGAAALILSKASFRNDEVKQILKTTSDDIERPGWDLKSGSGRLNIFKALSSLAPSFVKFSFPYQDFASSDDTLTIKATVLSPYFLSYDLEYGTGLNPDSWTKLVSGSKNQLQNEILAKLNISALKDSAYTLRIILSQNNGLTTEERVNFHIERGKPRVYAYTLSPVYYGERPTILAEVITENVSLARLYFRKAGASEFQFINLDGFATNNQFVTKFHYGFIPKQLIEPGTSYELYIEAVNRVGSTLKMIDSASGGYFRITTPEPYVQMAAAELEYKLPMGNLYKDPVNITRTDSKELLFNEFYNTTGINYGIYSLKNGEFSKVDSIQQRIPVAAGDFNNDGKTDILGMVYPVTYIDEQEARNSSSFINKLYSDTLGIPVLADDLDKDGNTEIIVYRHNDPSLYLYRITNKLGVTFLRRIDNFTSSVKSAGGNTLSRQVTIADLNNDGKKEIWFADAEGDIISYTVNSPGQFTAGDTLETGMQVPDESLFSKGDFNGDGSDDLGIILHSSNLAPYYNVLIISRSGNQYKILGDGTFLDQASEFRSTSFTKVYNSLRFADIDNDFSDELIINIFPYSYIMKYQPGGNRIVFYKEDVNTSAVFTGDLNHNGVKEIAWQTTEGVRFYEFTASLRPFTPNYLTGNSLDSTSIRLTWKGTGNKYFIYRGTSENGISLYDSTALLYYTDSNVQPGREYFYYIKSFDQLKQYKYSEASSIVRIYSHTPAKPVRVISRSSRSAEIFFSERINNTVENLEAFIVTGIGAPNSVSPASQYSYLLSFNNNLLAGENALIIKGMKDFYGSEIKADTLIFNVSNETENNAFFISSFEITDPYSVRIVYNLDVDPQGASLVQNYTVEPWNEIVSAAVENGAGRSVLLKFRNPVGSVGKEYKLTARNLTSTLQSGLIPINENSGSIIVLRSFKQNLDDIYVYPNPYRATSGPEAVTFANLPQYTDITIWTVSGRKIISIHEESGTGGVSWNLRDENGNEVESGVYIYRAVQFNSQKEELGSKLGKFAILR